MYVFFPFKNSEDHIITSSLVENPAKKWPSVFANIPLFVNYPYLLPCAVAASVTFIGEFRTTLVQSTALNTYDIGSILSLFLGPDCGPREGAIRLPIEKTTAQTGTSTLR